MIRVNRKDDIEWEPDMTVERVLDVCKFTRRGILVNVNGRVVPREEYETYAVNDGDEVQVTHFVGGG